MAKKTPTSPELADLYLKENVKIYSSKLDAFFEKHDVKAHGFREAVEKEIQKKLEEKRDSRLEIFDRKIKPPIIFGPFIRDGLGYAPAYIGDTDENPEPLLLCSNKTFIRKMEFEERGFKFAGFQEYGRVHTIYGWQPNDIRAWLQNEKKIVAADLFKSSRNYFKKYIYIGDERAYDFLSCYVLALHVWPAFDAFPRLIISALINSGKSQLVRAIRNLGPYAIISGDASKASLLRLGDNPGLKGLDNFDLLPDDQFQEIMHWFEIGYQADMPALRVDEKVKGKGRFASELNASGPALAATVNFAKFSEAARSRAIVLNMERAPADVVVPELPADAPDEEANKIRSKMYGWGLENLTGIKADAVKFDSCAYGFTARDAQLVKPILVMAKTAHQNTLQTIASWLRENFCMHHVEDEFGEPQQITRALHELYGKGQELEVRVVVRDVAERWLAALEIFKQYEDGRTNIRYGGICLSKSKAIASFIRGNVPGAKKEDASKVSGGILVFNLRRNGLERLFKRYKLIENQEKLNTTFTTNSTNTTITTNTTKKDTSTNESSSKNVGFGGFVGEKRGGAKYDL